MKLLLILFGLLVVLGFVGSSPIVKRDVNDKSPLNEVNNLVNKKINQSLIFI